MPWCPNCKYEYKEGVTVCADCGATLLDTYEEVEELERIKQEEEQKELAMRIQQMQEKAMEEGIIPEPRLQAPVGEYVKAKDKAEDYKSSGYALVCVGGLGVIVIILNLLGVIKINMAANVRVISLITLSTMFLLFLVFGIKSLLDAKRYLSSSDEEESKDIEIHEWFLNNYSAELIDSEAVSDEEGDEMRYFARSEAMRRILTEQFGDLEEAYLEHLVEELYTECYEH